MDSRSRAWKPNVDEGWRVAFRQPDNGDTGALACRFPSGLSLGVAAAGGVPFVRPAGRDGPALAAALRRTR